MSEPLFESTAPKYPVLFWWGDSEYEVEKFNKLVQLSENEGLILP